LLGRHWRKVMKIGKTLKNIGQSWDKRVRDDTAWFDMMRAKRGTGHFGFPVLSGYDARDTIERLSPDSYAARKDKVPQKEENMAEYNPYQALVNRAKPKLSSNRKYGHGKRISDKSWRESYDTPLTKKEMKEFKAWAKKEKVRWETDLKKRGIKATWDLEDQKRTYDVQGYWKALNNATTQEEKNILFDPVSGHANDMFKKPTHPSFSTGSIYDKISGSLGGQWEGEHFTPTAHNIRNLGGVGDALNWFDKNEPGVTIGFNEDNFNKWADEWATKKATEGTRGDIKGLAW